MNKRTKRPARSLTKKVARKTTTSKKPKTQANHPIHAQRNEPKHRGIHKDAIQAGRAPTGASTCIACDRKIEGNHPRWGIKYAGNPLSIPVLPLYGSHPMVQWCHAGGCGLAFFRYKDLASEAPEPCVLPAKGPTGTALPTPPLQRNGHFWPSTRAQR